jgi:hypothetical protein
MVIENYQPGWFPGMYHVMRSRLAFPWSRHSLAYVRLVEWHMANGFKIQQ